MKRLFSYDSAVTRFLMQFCSACCLGVLWLVCSLPVFTAGAATAALYSVTIKLVRETEGTSVTRQFFAAFRSNFKQATQLWLMMLALGALLSVDGYVLYHMRHTSTGTAAILWTLLLAVLIAAALLYAAVMAYLFPLVAYFENNNRSMLKNALLMGVRYLFCTIAVLAIHGALLWVVINLFTPLFLFGEGLAALFSSYLLSNVLMAVSGENRSSTDEAAL